jgi:hypothetical protein
MDAQEMHDYEMSMRNALSERSRQRLESLLRAKEKKVLNKKYIYRSDNVISSDIHDHPELTPKKPKEIIKIQEFLILNHSNIKLIFKHSFA